MAMRRTLKVSHPIVAYGLLMTVLPTSSWSGEPAQTQEIYLTTDYRVAFYEEAPESLATSMRAAVTHACKEKTDASRLPWLCHGSQLKLLRGVVVTGDELPEGFVCAADQVGDLRYYAPDMLEENASCTWVAYDDKQHVHIVLKPRPSKG